MFTGGFSRARLERMRTIMAGYVERGTVPGSVTLISRRGEVHVDLIGTQAFDQPQPMQRDTIFRISSMTKPIAAVATLLLVEECRLRLDAPVDDLLPELANRTVLKRLDGPLDDTVPAHRPITVRDLLTMRMGFGFITAPDDVPIQQAARALQVLPGPPHPAAPHPPDEWLRRFATLPLLHQPGEGWMYPTAFSVLGILLARAADQPLETLLHERIFEPLGMRDTGFYVPDAQRNRLAHCYGFDPDTGTHTLYDGGEASQWRYPPAFPDAGDGLVSTIDDYLAFGQMLLNYGKYGNQRILARPTVELMTSDQLTADQRAAGHAFLGNNRGWGFGLSIITRRDDIAAVPGRFGWDGGLGTSWYADPRENLVAILMTQVLGFPAQLDTTFWTAVYQALDD